VSRVRRRAFHESGSGADRRGRWKSENLTQPGAVHLLPEGRASRRSKSRDRQQRSAPASSPGVWLVSPGWPSRVRLHPHERLDLAMRDNSRSYGGGRNDMGKIGPWVVSHLDNLSSWYVKSVLHCSAKPGATRWASSAQDSASSESGVLQQLVELIHRIGNSRHDEMSRFRLSYPATIVVGDFDSIASNNTRVKMLADARDRMCGAAVGLPFAKVSTEIIRGRKVLFCGGCPTQSRSGDAQLWRPPVASAVLVASTHDGRPSGCTLSSYLDRVS
jgi:hypothetical protein